MKKKMPIVTENQVKAQVREGLNAFGWFNWANLQGLGSKKGLTDRTAIKNGVVLWIECKRPGKPLSPKQEEFRDELILAGGHFILAYSFHDVVKYLNEKGLG